MAVNVWESLNYELLPVVCKNKKKEDESQLLLTAVHISAVLEVCIMWWLKEPIAVEALIWICITYCSFGSASSLLINLRKCLFSLSGPAAAAAAVSSSPSIFPPPESQRGFFSFFSRSEYNKYRFLINGLVHREVCCVVLWLLETHGCIVHTEESQ